MKKLTNPIANTLRIPGGFGPLGLLSLEPEKSEGGGVEGEGQGGKTLTIHILDLYRFLPVNRILTRESINSRMPVTKVKRIKLFLLSIHFHLL